MLIKAVGPNNDYTIGEVETYIELYTHWHEAESDKGDDAIAKQWRTKLSSTAKEATGSGD